jgi:hypothetical protein
VFKSKWVGEGISEGVRVGLTTFKAALKEIYNDVYGCLKRFVGCGTHQDERGCDGFRIVATDNYCNLSDHLQYFPSLETEGGTP